MFKYKTTAKAIRQSAGDIISIGYCGAQYLLREHNATAYTCGVYGWNFDVYQIDGVTICTGYRGMPGRRPNNCGEYEQRARAIWEDYNRDYNERAAEVEKLLHEFIAQA